LNFSTLVLLKY